MEIEEKRSCAHKTYREVRYWKRGTKAPFCEKIFQIALVHPPQFARSDFLHIKHIFIRLALLQ